MPEQKNCILIYQDTTSKKIARIELSKCADSLYFAKELQKKYPDSEIFIDCDEDSFLILGEFPKSPVKLLEISKETDLHFPSLVPFIAIDPFLTILMQAFGNEEALSLSIESGYAHYFSRKRNSIWKKGEESGMIQSISQIYYLSETPSIIFQTKEKIPSCHTGFYSCFYRKLEKDSFVTNYSKKEFDPNQIYGSKNSGNLKSL